MEDLTRNPAVNLSRANAAEVRRALSNPSIPIEDVRSILRNPSLSGEMILDIADNRRAQAIYDVRLAIVLHPSTPLGLGLRLLPTFGWRDLVRIVDDFRRPPPMRVRAEHVLLEKIGELTPGQRIALARVAPRAVVKMLVGSSDAKVIDALLGNPRLVEEDAATIARNADASPSVLATVARSDRWGRLYQVRMALAQNPNCPAMDALRALHGLSERDLERILTNPDTPRLLQIGAERLLADEDETTH